MPITIGAITEKNRAVYHIVRDMIQERFGEGSVFLVQEYIHAGPWDIRWMDRNEELRNMLMVDIGNGRLGKWGRQEYKLFFTYLDNGDYAFFINDAGGCLHEPTEDEPIELLYERHVVGYPKNGRSFEELVDYVYEQVEKLKSEFRKTDFKDKLALNIMINHVDEIISAEHWVKRADTMAAFFIQGILTINVNLFQMRITFSAPNTGNVDRMLAFYEIKEEQYPRIKEAVNECFRDFLDSVEARPRHFDRLFDFSDKTILKQKENAL